MELAPFAASSCNFNYTYTYTYCSIGFAPRVRSWIRAAAEGGGDGTDRRRSGRLAADGPRVVEVAAPPAAPVVSGGGGAGFGARDAELAMWEKLGAVVRLSYGIGIYAAMALTGRFICQMAGIDYTGGFHPSLTAVVEGLGYAAPPIMALLFILDDEVVKYSPHARAIRDVEDEELRSFFYGMSPWQASQASFRRSDRLAEKKKANPTEVGGAQRASILLQQKFASDTGKRRTTGAAKEKLDALFSTPPPRRADRPSNQSVSGY